MKHRARRNPRQPRSGYSSDFWIAAISSATKSRQVASALLEYKGMEVSPDQLFRVASDVLERTPSSIRVQTLRYIASYLENNSGKDPDASLVKSFFYERDGRLLTWISSQLVRWAIEQLPQLPKKSIGIDFVKKSNAALDVIEQWVVGDAGLKELKAQESSLANVQFDYGEYSEYDPEFAAFYALIETEHALLTALISERVLRDPTLVYKIDLIESAHATSIDDLSRSVRSSLMFKRNEYSQDALRNSEVPKATFPVALEAIRSYPGMLPGPILSD